MNVSNSMIGCSRALLLLGLLAGCSEPVDARGDCEQALLHAAACDDVEFELETCDPDHAETVLSSSCEELEAEAASGEKADQGGEGPRITLGPARASEREALADVAAHIRADPSNVEATGEYCGLIVRTSNGRHLAIRYGANSTGSCGTNGRPYTAFLRFGESIGSGWHSHPLRLGGGANGQGSSTTPPSGGDAMALVLGNQYFGLTYEYVLANHDPRIVYWYGLVTAPTHSYEQMLARNVSHAINAVGAHWVAQGHSVHSAWITAQREFTDPNGRRSPGGAATADIGTGIDVRVSYDGGVTFR